MATLIKTSDEVNFKLATTALDAGTKIYVSRVDCVHTDVTKVASSIFQALDNKSKKTADDEADEDQPPDDPENEQEDESANKKTKAKRSQRRKTGSKIAGNQESLNVAKVETNVEIDPIFHKLTTSHDMGNVNSLFLANLKVDRVSALVLDSNADTDLKSAVTAVSVCNDSVPLNPYLIKLQNIVEKESRVFDDKFFLNFKFNRNDGNCETEYNRLEDDIGTQKTRTSAFTFDLNADVDEEDDHVPTDFNLSANGDIFDELGQESDDEVDEMRKMLSGPNRHSIMQAVNLQSLPDLRMLLNEESAEYSYFKNKITCSWAGPAYWKPNQFLKSKHLRQILQSRYPTTDNVLATASKRQKKQFPDIDFEDEDVPGSRSTNKSKLKVATLEKWGDSNEASVLPEYVQFDEDELLRPYNRSGVYFRMVERRGSSEHTGSQDKRETAFSVAASCEPMDGIDCPDDMDFPPTQTCGIPFSQLPASQGTTEAFTGSNLVDEPDAIKQIDLPFAKYAKRMDVKKLKRAMLDLIQNPSLNDSLPTSGSTADVIRFSDLYQELPAKITSTMTKDMSPPIAFVTLLHLANENVTIINACCHWLLITALFCASRFSC